jgi:hypothetical protein
MTMQKSIYVLAVLLAVKLAFGQGEAPVESPQPSITLPPDLARILTDYETDWTSGKSVALAELFAEDGFVLGESNPMVRGRANIERFYRGSHRPLSLRAVAYATDGKVGYILGGFGDAPGLPDRGKFTLTLQKDASGRWLIMSDMDNGNGRAQGSD